MGCASSLLYEQGICNFLKRFSLSWGDRWHTYLRNTDPSLGWQSQVKISFSLVSCNWTYCQVEELVRKLPNKSPYQPREFLSNSSPANYDREGYFPIHWWKETLTSVLHAPSMYRGMAITWLYPCNLIQQGIGEQQLKQQHFLALQRLIPGPERISLTVILQQLSASRCYGALQLLLHTYPRHRK